MSEQAPFPPYDDPKWTAPKPDAAFGYCNVHLGRHTEGWTCFEFTAVPAGQDAAHSVAEVHPIEMPGCRICGARTAPKGYQCLSCGVTTEPTAASQDATTREDEELAQWKALGFDTPEAVETVLRAGAEMARIREKKIDELERALSRR